MYDGIQKRVRKLKRVKTKLIEFAEKVVQTDESASDILRVFDILSSTLLALESDLERQEMKRKIEQALLISEGEKDTVDRDAREAQVLERYRIAAERGEKVANVLQKSISTVANIQADLAAACPLHATRVNACVCLGFKYNVRFCQSKKSRRQEREREREGTACD